MPDYGPRRTRALSAIAQADAVMPVRLRVMEALALADIHAAYFLAPLTADPRVGRLLIAIGTSRIWERHYRARLHLCDPLPNYSRNCSGAFFWHEDIQTEGMSWQERRYLSIAARFGVGRGIGTACYGPHGRSGFFGAIWHKEEPPEEAELQWVAQVSQTSFRRYCRLIRKDDDFIALSNRELEVLGWMSEGKSNSVIAQILEISRSTVDMYVRRIFAKLDVTDRTAACLRALSLGLIVTSDYQRLLDETRKRTPDEAIR